MRPLLPIALLSLAMPLAGQVRPVSLTDPAIRYREAVARWEAGDYPAALGHLNELLTATTSGAWLDSVALLTGERFRTRELTSDGTRPAFSPDGRLATWQSRAQQDGPPVSTTVVRVADGAPVRTFAGFQGAAIAPGGALIALLPTAAGGPPVAVRDIVSGTAVPVEGLTGWTVTSAVFGHTDTDLYLVAHQAGRVEGNAILHVQREGAGYRLRGPLNTGPGYRGIVVPVPASRHLIFTVTRGVPAQLVGGVVGLRTATSFGVVDVVSGASRIIEGRAPSFSADGSTLVYLTGTASAGQVVVEPVAGGTPVVVKQANVPLATPALSPDGSQIVFGMTPTHDSELYLIGRDGTGERRLTREIQHDLFPVFLDRQRILAITGEGRHRRSWLYDVTTLQRERLFHNNTIRTIAPEYDWIASPDGRHVLIQSERDGNTVTLDRGIYLMDLTDRLTVPEIRTRVATMLHGETALRQRGEASFAPIAAAVRAVTDQVDVSRIYRYEKSLFDLDSKHISRPGNARAIDYLMAEYGRFGYTPERQSFSPPGALGGSSANVLAILPGTEHPELVYVVSSHFDSRAEGPGADDNSSGTAALLEAARVMAQHPQPATIIFASFTGEESGLLGSREFVRQAQAKGMRIVGALNNDMIGWANDARLDNTVRYSNPGIRDIQHAAAMQFSRLITYDALYYKSTDAHAYYEAYGDIVGGIGSYPVLGNPHYHQPHDVLEVINHQLVAEVSKTTVATLMLLASSPSRLSGLEVVGQGNQRRLQWTASPERGITEYRVVAFGADGSERMLGVTGNPSFTLPALPAGTTVGVKAWNSRGLGGWDWARLTLP